MNNIFEFTIPMYLPAISLFIMTGGLMLIFSSHPQGEERIPQPESPSTRTN
jgi:hypothetical protein